MQITKACDYAFRALVDLARLGGGPAETARVARDVDVPPIYLRKILQGLSHAGLVRTLAGTGGGVALARSPKDISLKDIVEALEGPITLSECIDHPETCVRSDTCSVRPNLAVIQESIKADLASRTIAQLA